MVLDIVVFEVYPTFFIESMKQTYVFLNANDDVIILYLKVPNEVVMNFIRQCCYRSYSFHFLIEEGSSKDQFI